MGAVEPGSKSYPHASLFDWSQAGLGVKHLSSSGAACLGLGLGSPWKPKGPAGRRQEEF